MNHTDKTMDKIVALCKGRGFIFPGSEIYGGLANTWDYGPLGARLKNNVKETWRKRFIQERHNSFEVDADILMHPRVWEASGHIASFSDPLLDCKECKMRIRADNLIEAFDPEAHPDAMNRQVCREMTTLGVLYSYQTLCNDMSMPTPPGVYGFTQTLDELHIPHVFLSDDAMEEQYLKELKVLYIGSSSCLSDQQVDAIKKFAERGGTIIMNTFAGTRDANGDLRKKWPFEKIMGFSPAAGMQEVRSISDGKASIIPEERKLSAAELVPVQQTNMLFSLKLKNGNELPGIIEKPFGKGKFLYSPVRMEELFYSPLVPDGKVNKLGFDVPMAKFYRRILRKNIGQSSLLQTNAPEKVFMTLYREKDQVLVHLLNGTAGGIKKGEKGTPKFRGEPFPSLTKDISITVPCFGKKGVFAVSPDFKGRKALAAKYNPDGTVTVTLPGKLLKGYTLIRIY